MTRSRSSANDKTSATLMRRCLLWRCEDLAAVPPRSRPFQVVVTQHFRDVVGLERHTISIGTAVPRSRWHSGQLTIIGHRCAAKSEADVMDCEGTSRAVSARREDLFSSTQGTGCLQLAERSSCDFAELVANFGVTPALIGDLQGERA